MDDAAGFYRKDENTMKPQIRLIAMLVLGVSIVCFSAYAELVQGEVVSLDLNAQSFMLARSDPATGAADAEGINVLVRPDTEFKGIAGLSELREGDEVWTELEININNGTWEAGSVSIDKVKIQDTQPSQT